MAARDSGDTLGAPLLGNRDSQIALASLQASQLEALLGGNVPTNGRPRLASSVALFEMKTRRSVSFNVGRFAKIALYHLLFPWTIPLCLRYEGRTFCRNIGILSWPIHFQWVGILTFNLLMMMVLFAKPGDTQHISSTEILLGLGCYVIHKLMVGAKYGYMHPDLFAKMHHRKLEPAKLQQTQLVDGWWCPAIHVINEEIDRAAERLQVDLRYVYFHFTATKDCLQEFLRLENMSFKSTISDKLRAACVESVVRALFYNVNDVLKTRFSDWTFLALGFVTALLPTLIRLMLGEPAFGRGNLTAVSIILGSALLALSFFGTLCRFLAVGVLDYHRRYEILRRLVAMIDFSHHSDHMMASSDNESRMEKTPFVDLTLGTNIVAWHVTRQIVQNFGLVYRARIHLYASYVLAFMIVLTVVVVVHLVQSIAPAATVLLSAWLLVVLSLLLGYMAWYGACAQDQFEVFQSNVIRIQFAVRELRSELSLPYRVDFNLGAYNGQRVATAISPEDSKDTNSAQTQHTHHAEHTHHNTHDAQHTGSSTASTTPEFVEPLRTHQKDSTDTDALGRQQRLHTLSSSGSANSLPIGVEYGRTSLGHVDSLLESVILVLRDEALHSHLSLLGLDSAAILRGVATIGASLLAYVGRSVVAKAAG